MPRTSVSTFSPALYSLGPKAVEGTSGVNDIFANGILASSKLLLICATCWIVKPSTPISVLVMLIAGNVANLSIVAKWCRVNKKHLIYVSGGIVYRDIHADAILENSEIGVNAFGGVYGESKYLGEIEIGKEILQGLRACVIRPSSIYGGYKLKNGMIENFVLKALKDKKIEIYAPFEQIIGFVHSHDVATSILFAHNNDLKGTFNISQSENMSVLNICEFISNVTDCTLILKTGRGCGLVSELDRYKLVNNKIKELGWREHYDIETGIWECINALK